MKKGKDYIGVGVGAMIFDDRGRVLLARRGQKAKNERGCWDLPGGGVDFNEKRSDAIIREVKEEMGIDIDVVAEMQTIDHLIEDEGQHWITTTFIARVKDGQQPKIMEPEKCDGLDWFDLEALPSPLAISTTLNLGSYIERSV